MNPNSDNQPTDGKGPDPERPGLWGLIKSVLGAAVGIQSEKRREADFQHGKPGDYIALGIVFVIVFIITLVIIVKTVIANATGG